MPAPAKISFQSLLEAEHIAAPAAAKPRKSMDATWSKRKKLATTILACVCGGAALTFGVWKAWSMTAPGLPSTAKEAVAIINSARFDNLDDSRKEQYFEEASRLFRQLSDDERKALRDDPRFRDAMMKLREDEMDQRAEKFARGEKPDGPGGDRPQPTEEERKRWEQMRKEWEDRQAKMTDEEKKKAEEDRQQRQQERMKQMDQRIGNSINSGSAQKMGLRSEMMKRMGGGRFGGGGGGGRGPGGGGGGGRGPR